MVMRKFRRSLDNGNPNEDPESSPKPAAVTALSGLNSPRLQRKGPRGGSFSDGLNNGDFGSPGVRRRRSRIPSEEDDQLFNFLVTGGQHDGSRERNTSVGNLSKDFARVLGPDYT